MLGCRSASRTSCPRDRALGDVAPRRFESATTSPVPLAPSHVPPACRSRGAMMTGVPSRTAGGSAGRIEDSSRFIPRAMSYPGTDRQKAMRVHTAAPHFICLRSYARICATRATSGRPALVADSIARSYVRIAAARGLFTHRFRGVEEILRGGEVVSERPEKRAREEALVGQAFRAA